MEDELRIYESNVKAFEDYCAERKLSCMLQVEAYPLSVTVYQSGDSRQIRGQLSMNRLKNHAKKIVIAFLHQFFAKSMLGEE